MKKKRNVLAILAACLIGTGTAAAMDTPVTLAGQGSFFAGGKVVTAPGVYKDAEPTNFDGETLHGDAAYVFWQEPLPAKETALIFLHGYGQSGKTWESTPDGRDGFQNIFLAKGYKTFIVDEPRRGRAGNSTVPATLSATPQDQLWYDNFRIGRWPEIYENVAVPRDAESRAQFFYQMTPDTGAFDVALVAEAMVSVMEKAGDGVLVTHSAGGGPGWLAAARSDKVKGVIALEPGTFPFPKGEVPETEATISPFPAAGMEVSDEDFRKLLQIPMVVYFGDNIKTGSEPDVHWGLDNWRVRLNLAKKWEAVMKRHGGDVEVVYLPDIGIRGNTHFLMADLNNKDVADVMDRWMQEKGLAKEGGLKTMNFEKQAATGNGNPFGLVYGNALTENVPGRVQIRPVAYEVDGIRVAANLYLPADYEETSEKRYAAVTVAHPNGGSKEQVAGLYAQRLAELGYIALACDARYQGASGGEPRLRDYPANRIEDISGMVDYLSTLPKVDPERIASLGICGGGGYTLAAAQTDKRIKAVATLSMFNSGRVRRNGFQDADIAGIPTRLAKAADARNRALRGEILYEGFLPPHATDDELRQKMEELPENTLYRDGIEYYGLSHRHPNATGSYTTESFMKLMAFDVEDRMDLINQPLLMLAGEKADTLYMTEAAYEKATGTKKKELVLIPGASHIRTYWVPEYVDKAVEALKVFFGDNL